MKMELWIRSHDKENLIQIKNPICVYDNKIIYKESASYTITIGEYKTKERALKVLDEIQNKLNIRHCNDAGIQFILINEMTPIIYEMPKD